MYQKVLIHNSYVGSAPRCYSCFSSTEAFNVALQIRTCRREVLSRTRFTFPWTIRVAFFADIQLEEGSTNG